MILRDRDTSSPANGTLNQRLYSLCNANYNVIALADTSGDIQERYCYNVYCKVTIYDATWSNGRSKLCWRAWARWSVLVALR